MSKPFSDVTVAPSRPVKLFFFLFFLSLIFDIGISKNFIGLHAPLSDDLSMIAFSRAWSWDWLTKGLADYFIVYPEYYGPQSNFIRPVSNIVYWAFGTLVQSDAPFLSNKIQLIVMNFGTHAAICACMVVIIRRLSASWLIAALVFVSLLFIPTFWTTPSPTYSSFVFDELAVLFCLIALLFVGGRHYVAMSVCLGLALLTKEIAFPIVAAFGVVFLIQRQWKTVFAIACAVAVWACLRINGFGFHAEGVYVFTSESTSLAALLDEKLRNIFTLPFGPVFYEDIFSGSHIAYFNRSGLLLAINITIFLALFFVLLRTARNGSLKATYSPTDTYMRDNLSGDPHYRFVVLASTAAAFSFLFDAYVGANYRYAFNFLPFLFIAIAGIASFPKLRLALCILFAIGSIAASAPAISRLQSGSEFEAFRYDSIRKLFSALRTHQDSKRLLILNDFVLGFANPKSIEILVPFPGLIIRGTSLYLDGCTIADLKTIETQVLPSASSLEVKTKVKGCGQFTFESSPKLANFISGNRITRNDLINYEFEPGPNLNAATEPGAQWDRRNLTAFIKDSDILYFDFGKNDWVFVRAQKAN